jgi:signal transduction histidine kinase
MAQRVKTHHSVRADRSRPDRVHVAAADQDARIMEIVGIMAKVAARDFSQKPVLVDGDDPLSVLTVGFRFMIEDLERTLGELESERSELQRTNEKLKTLDRSKTRFINTAAHELGTPLTPIILQLALLRQGAHGPLTPAQADSLKMLDRNMNRLAYLVSEMLDVARLQSRRMRLQTGPTDLALLATQCVESFARQAQTQGIMLSYEGPSAAKLVADENRLNQVLFNLVSNALKFTPPGGQVRVSLQEDRDGYALHVHDTGAGLERQEIARLFQPFSQVHETIHGGARGGTGLGLFISKGIVELHGGQIGCTSAGHGHGSVFKLWVPKQCAVADAAAAPSGDERDPF